MTTSKFVRTSQPQGPVRLNNGHWAANRIVWAIGPWSKPFYDHKIGSKAGFVLSAGTAKNVTTGIGVGTDFDTSTYYSSTTNALMYPLAWLSVGIGQTGTTNYAIGGAGILLDSNTRWQLDNYGGNFRSVVVDTSNVNPGLATSTKTVANDEPFTVFFSLNSAKVSSTYFKGIKNSAAANTGIVAGWTGYSIGVIPYSVIQGHYSKPLLLNVLFSGEFSDAEAFELIRNPWQLFEPEERRIWVGPNYSTGDNLYVPPRKRTDSIITINPLNISTFDPPKLTWTNPVLSSPQELETRKSWPLYASKALENVERVKTGPVILRNRSVKNKQPLQGKAHLSNLGNQIAIAAWTASDPKVAYGSKGGVASKYVWDQVILWKNEWVHYVDSANSGLRLGTATNLGTEFIVLISYECYSTQNSQGFISNTTTFTENGGFSVYASNQDQIFIGGTNGSLILAVTSSGIFLAGTKTTIAIRFSGSMAYLYRDGKYVNGGTIQSTVGSNSNGVEFGNFWSTTGYDAASGTLIKCAAILSNGDPASLSANPWQLFAPEPGHIWGDAP